MQTFIIPTGSTRYDIVGHDSTYILETGSGLSVTGDYAIHAKAGAFNDTIVIRAGAGSTGSNFAGILTEDHDVTVKNVQSGGILGFIGLQMAGADATVINKGVITGTGGAALVLNGDNASVTNFGKIQNLDTQGGGIHIDGGSATIVNSGNILAAGNSVEIQNSDADLTVTRGARIEGANDAILATTDDIRNSVHITNDGEIVGTEFAVELGSGNDTVINHFVMHGAISLGEGKDLFDNRGGLIDSDIRGRGGNDTLIVDDRRDTLAENAGEGYDTVRSAVSYTLSSNVERLTLIGGGNTIAKGNDGSNDLFGNASANQLFGFDGNDSLSGGKGNDRLVGGDGQDVFVFNTGFGHDTIIDFESGDDTISLRWKGIDDFTDLKSHMTFADGDVHITVGNDQLTISNHTKSQLSASDFDFHA